MLHETETEVEVIASSRDYQTIGRKCIETGGKPTTIQASYFCVFGLIFNLLFYWWFTPYSRMVYDGGQHYGEMK